jgi:hypothetical protein
MYMYSTEHEQWKLKLNVQILYLSYLPFCCSCYILAASAGTGAPRTPFPAAPAGFPFLHGSWPQPTQEASCSCHLHLAHHRSRRLAQVVVVYLALPLARARSATPPGPCRLQLPSPSDRPSGASHRSGPWASCEL